MENVERKKKKRILILIRSNVKYLQKWLDLSQTFLIKYQNVLFSWEVNLSIVFFSIPALHQSNNCIPPCMYIFHYM